MEILRRVENLFVKEVFRVFGFEYIPKSEIVSMKGGQHAISDEDAIYLKKNVLTSGPTREVVVFDSKGCQQSFKEIVGRDQADQKVVIYKR